MFKRFRKTLAVVAASLAMAVVPVAAVSAQATPTTTDNQIQSNLKCGTTLSTGDATTPGGTGGANGGCDVSGGTGAVNNIITTVVRVFSLVVGIVSVIMIIYGGFRYVTSGGDSGNVSSAKNTIIYAIIGLVVVALAQFIVQFVLDKVTNTGQ